MCNDDWPKPPIWPEDLPLIRELLTEEEFEKLLSRMVQVLPNGPLLDYRQALGGRGEIDVAVVWVQGSSPRSVVND